MRMSRAGLILLCMVEAVRRRRLYLKIRPWYLAEAQPCFLLRLDTPPRLGQGPPRRREPALVLRRTLIRIL